MTTVASRASAGAIRPISHVSTNQKVFSLVAPVVARGGTMVDVGAGEGYFSKTVGEHAAAHGIVPATTLRACDLFPDNFRYAGIACDPIGDDGRLPYDDGTFDITCSLEVIEHLEDQFRFVRELFRVTKPGGRAIVSTPNVLNVNSRWRYLHSGFGLLFDPLPLSSSDPVHTSGHIHPVSFYYAAYMFRRAGFRHVRVHFDRHKRSAVALLALLGLPIALGHGGFVRRLRRKAPAVYAENREILERMNAREMLTSRSIIVEGTRGA